MFISELKFKLKDLIKDYYNLNVSEMFRNSIFQIDLNLLKNEIRLSYYGINQEFTNLIIKDNDFCGFIKKISLKSKELGCQYIDKDFKEFYIILKSFEDETLVIRQKDEMFISNLTSDHKEAFYKGDVDSFEFSPYEFIVEQVDLSEG